MALNVSCGMLFKYLVNSYNPYTYVGMKDEYIFNTGKFYIYLYVKI